MADNKFKKDLDRQAVLFDYKNRIIDLLDNAQPLPDTDIYDEPVRYFKANEQWCKVIFGWLTILQMEAGWQDAEDTNYQGIQAILTFEEGIDVATSNDIRDAIYLAFNDLAKQIVSGRTTNISVGEDGTVSDPSAAADVDLPEDDPLTTNFDESAAAHSGSSLAVALGVSEFLTYLSTLFGADATPDTSLADAQFLVKARYQCIAVPMDAAISTFWANRSASITTINSLDREDLAQEIYCSAFGDVWDSVMRFVSKLTVPTVQQKQTCVALIDAIEETQWTIWQETGLASPSTEYLDYACVKSAPETVNLTVVGTTYLSLTQWKVGHRLRLTVTGVLTDFIGAKRDVLYHKTSAGVVTSAIANLSLFVGSAVTKPTTSQCPYNLTGSYVFTFDVALLSAMAITLAASGAWTPPATGTISVLIEDMGQVL